MNFLFLAENWDRQSRIACKCKIDADETDKAAKTIPVGKVREKLIAAAMAFDSISEAIMQNVKSSQVGALRLFNR